MKYRIDNDLHIHSFLSSCSGDENQTPENILKYAKENGLSHICLTNHFWDENVPGASAWYAPQNYTHLASALPLPTDKDVRFSFGCEADMDKALTLGIARDTFDKFEFIIIPTSHLHMSGFTIENNVLSAKDRAEYYMRRNNALLEMDLPFSKMGLAHFTSPLMAYNSETTRDEILNCISDSELYAFFDKVSNAGMGVELNISVADAASEIVQRPFRIARECGCKFYLGSDAHNVGNLQGAMSKFAAIINALELDESDKFTF